MRSIGMGIKWTTAKKTKDNAKDIPILVHNVRRDLTNKPAPIFCATMAATEAEKAEAGTLASAPIFSHTPIAAEATTPKLLIMAEIKINEALTSAYSVAIGIPTRVIFRASLRLGRKLLSLKSKALCLYLSL